MNRRRFLKEAAAVGLMASVPVSAGLGAGVESAQGKTIRVLCWSERTEPSNVYPEGINGAIASFLRQKPGLEVHAVSINDPEQGIGKVALDAADVLIWWGHLKHKDVDDARVAEAVRQIKDRGLGLIVIHSGHYSKVFKTVLGSSGDLGGVRGDGRPEFLKCVAPFHPISTGLGDFTIPQTEMFNEPFGVPPPEKVVFFSYWETGEQFRSCSTWTVGKGRVVYFRPGHETYPIYFQELPLRVVENSVYWCAHRT